MQKHIGRRNSTLLGDLNQGWIVFFQLWSHPGAQVGAGVNHFSVMLGSSSCWPCVGWHLHRLLSMQGQDWQREKEKGGRG